MHLVAKQAFPDAMGLMRNHVPLERPDLSNLDVDEREYEWGVIAAAIPGLAHCETYPEETWQCNVAGTLSLARQLAEMGIRPLWFSSDQVFDGTASPYADSDTPSPVNEYGQQKAEVEANFSDASRGTGLVVRLSKVYDTTPGSGTLLDGIISNLKNGGTEWGGTRSGVLPHSPERPWVDCTFRLMTRNASGIVNVAAGPISRLGLAWHGCRRRKGHTPPGEIRRFG